MESQWKRPAVAAAGARELHGGIAGQRCGDDTALFTDRLLGLLAQCIGGGRHGQ